MNPHALRRRLREPSLRLGGRRRLLFYTLLVILLLSGALWLVLHQFDLPDQLPNPFEPWLLKVHGAMAMAVLFFLGTMLYPHMLQGWFIGRNRLTGSLMATLAIVLVVSGYGLYYFDGEALRSVTDLIHWTIGLVGLPLMIWHIVRGRRSAAPGASE